MRIGPIEINFPNSAKTTQYEKKKMPPSVFTTPEKEGAFDIYDYAPAGGRSIVSLPHGIVTSTQNEIERIRLYRQMANSNEVSRAIQDIVNESIVMEEPDKVVTLDLENTDLTEGVKTKLNDAFTKILRLMKFKKRGQDLFKRWYIDGRIHFEVIVDEDNVKQGLAGLNYIDSMKIKKIREIVKKIDGATGRETIEDIKEYFLYADLTPPGGEGNFGQSKISYSTQLQTAAASNKSILFKKDSIIYAHSNLFDPDNQIVLSHLDRALKPYNQLKMMEDSLVIYRMSRAPERRIFYIDVGNLPKTKAESYMNELIQSYQSKLIYDPAIGRMKDGGDYMTMLDDFWLPRRDGKGTEVSTLPGGQNLGDMEDVNFFKQNLYEALSVPQSRLQPDQGFQLGRATEITRDELNFKKFINNLRQEFSEVFLQALRLECLLTGIFTEEEWEEISYDIDFEYNADSYFSELKNMEIMQDRINLYESLNRAEVIGKYYSNDYARREIFKQTEEEIKQMDKDIEDEKDDERYNEPEEDQFGMDGFGGAQPMQPGQMPPEDDEEEPVNPMRDPDNTDNPLRGDEKEQKEKRKEEQKRDEEDKD